MSAEEKNSWSQQWADFQREVDREGDGFSKISREG